MKIVSAIKWREVCVLFGASCANDINHPARARLSPRRWQRKRRCDRPSYEILTAYKTFRFDDHRSPRDRTTYDPSSRYDCQGKIARRFNGIVDPFRTTGIGSALDPADRTCARSRRSSLASRLRTIDEIARWWRNKPSGRIGAVDFTVDRRMNPAMCPHPESDKHFILLTYSQIF